MDASPVQPPFAGDAPKRRPGAAIRRRRRRRTVLLRRAGRVAVWTSVLGLSLVVLLAAAVVAAWASLRMRATRRHLVPAGTVSAFPQDADPRAPLLADATEVRAFLTSTTSLTRLVLVVPPTGDGPHTAILETFRARSPRDTRRAVVFSDVAGLSPDDSAEAQLRHDSNLPIDPASTLVAFPPDSAPWAARGRADVVEALRSGAWPA